MRYDRARQSLDRHATYIVATFVAGSSRGDSTHHRLVGRERSAQAGRSLTPTRRGASQFNPWRGPLKIRQ